jgi:hypothetical protein
MVYLKDNIKDDFGIYINTVSHIFGDISDQVNEFAKKIEDRNNAEPEIEIEENYGESELDTKLGESLAKLSNNLENRFYFNTLIIYIYSFFDYSLVELCKLLDYYQIKEQNFKDAKGKGIKKMKNYIYSIFGIDISKFKKYHKITEIRKFRNLIIHNGANIIIDLNHPLEEQKDYNFFYQNPKFDVTSGGYIFISDFKYIKEYLEISESFVSEILEKVKKEL